MSYADLVGLLREQFPDSEIPDSYLELSAERIPEWDSLSHISLLLSIEDHYGIRFSLQEIGELNNMKNIVIALEAYGVPHDE